MKLLLFLNLQSYISIRKILEGIFTFPNNAFVSFLLLKRLVIGGNNYHKINASNVIILFCHTKYQLCHPYENAMAGLWFGYLLIKDFSQLKGTWLWPMVSYNELRGTEHASGLTVKRES